MAKKRRTADSVLRDSKLASPWNGSTSEQVKVASGFGWAKSIAPPLGQRWKAFFSSLKVLSGPAGIRSSRQPQSR